MVDVNQTSRLSLSISWTWAKHLQFLRHARGSHVVDAAAGAVIAAFAEDTVKAALLDGRRRDGRSVRINLAGVIASAVDGPFGCPVDFRIGDSI